MTVILSSVAKSRSISLPLDLEAQISSMLSTSALNSLSRTNPSYRSTSRSSRPAASTNPWDYKNIIEKLQVLAPITPCFARSAAISVSGPSSHRFWVACA